MDSIDTYIWERREKGWGRFSSICVLFLKKNQKQNIKEMKKENVTCSLNMLNGERKAESR